MLPGRHDDALNTIKDILEMGVGDVGWNKERGMLLENETFLPNKSMDVNSCRFLSEDDKR